MKDALPESAGLPFDYEIIRSRRKTLSIHVRDGKVEVRSPLQAPADWVQGFINQKAAWICRQLEEQRRRESQRLVLAEGRAVPFLGRPRTLQVVLNARGRVEIDDDRLLLFTPENTPAKLERLWHRWLLERAREYMVPATFAVARRLGVEGKVKDVMFRKTRSKWGHCCRDGTIQYNWLVMMAPRAVVDYLVAHECSHLLHMNHSAAFWDTVARVCPEYRERRRWLREHGHRLWTE